MDRYPHSGFGVAGGSTGGKGSHQSGEGEKIGGSIGFLRGFGSAPSVSHGLLMAGDGEHSDVEEGVGEDSGAHAGGGVVAVSKLNRFRIPMQADLTGRERKMQRSRGAVIEVVPPRRAGRKAMRIAISIDVK